MKHRALLIITGALAAASLCATETWSQRGDVHEDIGAPPSRDEFFRLATAEIRKDLRDPESARIAWPYPVMRMRFSAPYRGDIPGYATCAEVNGSLPVVVVYNRGGIVYSDVFASDLSRQPCSHYRFEQNFEWREADPDRWEIHRVRDGRLQESDRQSPITGVHWDCVRLRLRPGVRYRITLRSDDFDAFLAIHRDSCTGDQLWQNDDLRSGDVDARVVLTAERNLFARIQPSRQVALGGYELVIEKDASHDTDAGLRDGEDMRAHP